MFSDSHDVWVGHRYGPYQIVELLGKGTVANVYRAQTRSDEQVALKVLTPFAESRAAVRNLFEQEYELMARLDHPNVLRVYAAGVIGGAHYIEMELIEGDTLWSQVQGRNPPDIAAKIAAVQQVCSALDHVHANRVVHRDVKPANVLADGDRAVLFDFGLAFDLNGPPAESGRVFGSPLFLSPEQALAEPVTGRADIYSLGVTLYVLAAGTLPFAGERNQLLHDHIHTPPPDPRAHGVGDDLAVVIERAMAKRPEDRYASGADMAAALAMIDETEASPPARRSLLRRLVGR